MKKIPAPPFQRSLAKAQNKIQRNIDRGFIIDSPTVIVKPTGDGRLQLFLHPDVARNLGL